MIKLFEYKELSRIEDRSERLKKKMEFQNYLRVNNLVTFDQVKAHLESEPFHYRLKVDEAVYPSLYCICATEKSPSNEKWMRECNGLIVEKETNKVVCYTFDKMEDMEEGTVNPVMDAGSSHLELSIEGTLMRVYYYGGRWMLSTKKCVNAAKARWLSKRSFQELFEEVFPVDAFGRMDVNSCYSFILCHPENNMVVQYSAPQIFHISTREMNTFQEMDVDIGIQKVPHQPVVDGDLSILTTLASMTELSYEGYVLVDGYYHRQKFMSNIYKKARDVWGNTNYRFYRYLELRKSGEEALLEYLTFFPHDKDVFAGFEVQFVSLCQHVLEVYMKKNVEKKGTVPFYLKRLIFDIHGEFLKTRVMTDIIKVMDWMTKLDVKLICHMYHHWQEMLRNPEHGVSAGGGAGMVMDA